MIKIVTILIEKIKRREILKAGRPIVAKKLFD